LDEKQHQRAAGEVEKVRNNRRVRAAADDAVSVRQHSWVAVACWVRKTNLRAIEQLEKFHVRRRIRRSSVSRIIHKDLRLKCYKKRRAQQLTEANSMHELFSVASWETKTW